MIGENGEKRHIDGEAGDEQLKSLEDPLAAMVVVPSGERIGTEQEGSADAAAPAVKDPGADDLFACAV